MDGTEVRRGRIRSGWPALERLMEIGSGIVTLRCPNMQWLSALSYEMIVRNHCPGRKTLYLHWVDYHERFWTFNYDDLSRRARKAGVDPEELGKSVYLMREFSRDNNELDSNWRDLMKFSRFDFIILDSVGELYGERKDSSKPMAYSIGKFAQLCIRNECVGIALDRCERPLHNYLAHVSSVIMEMDVSREVSFSLLKHPCMAEISESFPRDGQYRLVRWL